MSEFYDDNFMKLLGKHPLYARVVEHLYEICVDFDQYNEEKEEMMQHLEGLTKRVAALETELNILTTMTIQKLVALEAEKQ